MKKLLFLLLLGGLMPSVWATHIRGGYVVYRNLENSLYEFAAHILFDGAGVPADEEIEMNVNGQMLRVRLVKLEHYDQDKPIIERTTKGIYTANYQVRPSPVPFFSGAFYRVGVLIRNRNPNTANIPNSVNTPFYIESLLAVAQSNNSIVLEDKISAIFVKSGQPLVLKNSIKDVDNDQVTFAIDTPFRNMGIRIDGYATPDRVNCTNCSLIINENSGELIWRTPSQAGSYVITLRIDEWRNVGGVRTRVGTVYRDIQIYVVNG
jgi:hypothetical protein